MNFKTLSGKKSWIVAVVFLIAEVLKLSTGQTTEAIDVTTSVAGALFAAWASFDRWQKFQKERNAGASIAEALTPIGGAKLLMAEGVLPLTEIKPSVLASPPPEDALERMKSINKDVEKKVLN